MSSGHFHVHGPHDHAVEHVRGHDDDPSICTLARAGQDADKRGVAGLAAHSSTSRGSVTRGSPSSMMRLRASIR